MDTFYSLFRTRKGLIGAGVLLILVVLTVFTIVRHRQKPGIDPEF